MWKLYDIHILMSPPKDFLEPRGSHLFTYFLKLLLHYFGTVGLQSLKQFTIWAFSLLTPDLSQFLNLHINQSLVHYRARFSGAEIFLKKILNFLISPIRYFLFYCVACRYILIIIMTLVVNTVTDMQQLPYGYLSWRFIIISLLTIFRNMLITCHLFGEPCQQTGRANSFFLAFLFFAYYGAYIFRLQSTF